MATTPAKATVVTVPASRTPKTPSELVDRALGRDANAEPKLEQTVAGADKVIGHSLKVPLPEPIVEEPILPFEPDAEPVGDWTPPRPRPAFDPLTAPLEDIAPD